MDYCHKNVNKNLICYMCTKKRIKTSQFEMKKKNNKIIHKKLNMKQTKHPICA